MHGIGTLMDGNETLMHGIGHPGVLAHATRSATMNAAGLFFGLMGCRVKITSSRSSVWFDGMQGEDQGHRDEQHVV